MPCRSLETRAERAGRATKAALVNEADPHPWLVRNPWRALTSGERGEPKTCRERFVRWQSDGFATCRGVWCCRRISGEGSPRHRSILHGVEHFAHDITLHGILGVVLAF
jgi:hypothetical protein